MNDDLQNVLNRARNAVTEAGKKAGTLVDIARLNLKINDVKTAIDRLYRDIGEIVYKKSLDDAVSDERVPALLERITDRWAELKRLEELVADAKAPASCAVCRGAVGKNDAFCKACGHRVG
ncbi:hypothetical protein FACS1894217_04200 [Clostridia bacterium]|nr:hypothetical protein FACS1894217_04200 [Clostridia bacterium]